MVDNNTGIENAVGYTGGGEAWYSNCVSIDCDTAFAVANKKGFYKQCIGKWTRDEGAKHVMFAADKLRAAIIGCEAEFLENSSAPNAFLTASAGGTGRVVAPVFDVKLVTNDATAKYLETGAAIITPAPAIKKED